MATQGQVSQVSRESTMSEPGIAIPPEVRAEGDDTIQGGTDVLEVWFAGCHSDMCVLPEYHSPESHVLL